MTRICPHCNQPKPGQGLTHHTRVCAIRQTLTDQDLRDLWQRTLHLDRMAKKLGVSKSTVATWLDDLGISRTSGPPRKYRPPLETVHGIAPLSRAPYNGCTQCPALPYCRDTVRPDNLRWILCEAPDPRQIRAWQRRGLSIPDLSAALRRIQPTLEATS
jgi:hypothetical protein